MFSLREAQIKKCRGPLGKLNKSKIKLRNLLVHIFTVPTITGSDMVKLNPYFTALDVS